MRISDWSSDVCSSDLIGACFDKPPGYACARGAGRKGGSALHCVGHGYDEDRTGKFCISHNVAMMRFSLSDRRRSEEHTSELQSLMRISYAVLCLKTKTNDDESIVQQHRET